MGRRREAADPASAHRLLYGGVGLTHGKVYEGNVGDDLKRNFTILGNTVNLAARLESMTRDLDVRLTMGSCVIDSAKPSPRIVSLGKQTLKGQSNPMEVFTLNSHPKLEIAAVRRSIEDYVSKTH